MTYNEKYYQLTDFQWDALQNLSSVSKMDCWFYLNHNEYGDFVQDGEDDFKTLNFADAVGTLFEGMSDWDWTCLSTRDKFALVKLSKDLVGEVIF